MFRETRLNKCKEYNWEMKKPLLPTAYTKKLSTAR
jgi:hypothetical protein